VNLAGIADALDENQCLVPACHGVIYDDGMILAMIALSAVEDIVHHQSPATPVPQARASREIHPQLVALKWSARFVIVLHMTHLHPPKARTHRVLTGQPTVMGVLALANMCLRAPVEAKEQPGILEAA
jgi:hypothetical protein